MIVARFGNTWASAYSLSQLKAEDEAPVDFPPAAQPIGGMGGAYDFAGDDMFPLAASTVRKSLVLSASTWAGIDAALDALKAALNVGRSRLWGQVRDNTHRWAWAKCTKILPAEVNKSYLRLPVSLEFYLQESLWYAETASQRICSNLVGSGTISPPLANAGTHRAYVKATVTSPGSAASSFKLRNETLGMEWTFGAAINASLVVDAAAYRCTLGGASAYASLALGAGQVVWMWLAPGNNTLSYVVGSNTVNLTLDWWSTYL